MSCQRCGNTDLYGIGAVDLRDLGIETVLCGDCCLAYDFRNFELKRDGLPLKDGLMSWWLRGEGSHKTLQELRAEFKGGNHAPSTTG